MPKNIDSQLNTEIFASEKYASQLNIASDAKKARIIAKIIKKEPKAKDILLFATKKDSNLFKYMPQSVYENTSMLNKMLESFDLTTENGAFEFYSNLSEAQKTSAKVTNALLEKYPQIFKEDFFVKTNDNIQKFLENDDYFEFIPSSFITNDNMKKIIASKNVMQLLEKISNTQINNVIFNDQETLKKLLDNKSVNWIANEDQIKKDLISKVSARNVLKNADALVEKNPTIIFGTKEKEVLAKDGITKKVEIIKTSYLPWYSFRKNAQIVEKAFKQAVADGTVENFSKKMPSNAMSRKAVLKAVEYCAVVDANNKYAGNKLKQKDATYNFVSNLDFGKFSNMTLKKIINASVDYAPVVLDVLYNKNKAKCEKIINDKIMYRAIKVDPSYVKYAKKPLNSRNAYAAVVSGMEMLNNKFAPQPPEKVEELNAIIKHILGIEKGDIKLAPVMDASSPIELNKVCDFDSLKFIEKWKILDVAQKINPALIAGLIANNEEFSKNILLKGKAKKIAKTLNKSANKNQFNESIQGEYKLINKTVEKIAISKAENNEKLNFAEKQLARANIANNLVKLKENNEQITLNESERLVAVEQKANQEKNKKSLKNKKYNIEKDKVFTDKSGVPTTYAQMVESLVAQDLMDELKNAAEQVGESYCNKKIAFAKVLEQVTDKLAKDELKDILQTEEGKTILKDLINSKIDEKIEVVDNAINEQQEKIAQIDHKHQVLIDQRNFIDANQEDQYEFLKSQGEKINISEIIKDFDIINKGAPTEEISELENDIEKLEEEDENLKKTDQKLGSKKVEIKVLSGIDEKTV